MSKSIFRFGMIGVVVLVSASVLQAGEQRAPVAEADPSEEAQQPALVDYSTQVLWYHDDPSKPLFIPQAELDATPLEELPLTGFALDDLRYAMRFPEDRRENDFPNECLYEGELGGPVHPDSQVTIEEWVADQPLAFVGTVLDTVPGWNAREGRPATLVYVRVDEILRNWREYLQAGQLIAYSRDQATIDLYGVIACSKLPDGVELPRLGERLLFTGSTFMGHPLFLSRHHVFPIRGDEVLPQPWTRFRDPEVLSLDEIRGAAARVTREEGR